MLWTEVSVIDVPASHSVAEAQSAARIFVRSVTSLLGEGYVDPLLPKTLIHQVHPDLYKLIQLCELENMETWEWEAPVPF